MYGRSIGSLEVYIRKGKHSRKMWSTKGNKEDKWHTAEIELAINIEYKVNTEFALLQHILVPEVFSFQVSSL